MISVPFNLLEFTILPLLSAQIVLLVLLYFSIFSRRVLVGFYLHALFLSSFAFYLVGQFLQYYTPLQTAIYILFLRGILLFGIGMPAAITVLCRMSEIALSLRQKLALYLASSVFYISIITIQDMVNYNYLFSPTFVEALPFQLINNHALIVITVHMALLLLPLGALFWREWMNARRPMHIALLLGVTSVPLVQLVSHHFANSYWLIYFTAIFTAACWAWAVYYDVRCTRGEAHAVKDELLWMMRRGAAKTHSEELAVLWQKLAKTSNGDIKRYKLQVRELLSRLADLSIDAGADSHLMLERADISTKAISKSASTEEVQSIATRETVALGGLIADLPSQRRQRVVAQAKHYMAEHFAQEIDNKVVAEHCAVSQGYLMRSFKEETGQTLHQFLTELRIQKAKHLLANKSVTETAFEVGFNNSNYFSTVFKKITGQSPVQYKQGLTH